MTYNVLMGTLNPTHSLTQITAVRDSACVCVCVCVCVLVMQYVVEWRTCKMMTLLLLMMMTMMLMMMMVVVVVVVVVVVMMMMTCGCLYIAV